MSMLAQSIPTADQSLDLVKSGGTPLVVFVVVAAVIALAVWGAFKFGGSMMFKMTWEMVMAIKETVVRLEAITVGLKSMETLPKSAEILSEQVNKFGEQNGRLTNIADRLERAK